MDKFLLVSIISDQAAPNAILAKYMRDLPDKPCDYLFVSTEEMERKGKSRNIQNSLDIASHSLPIVKLTNEQSIEAVKHEIAEASIDFASYAEIHVNLTGGTKLISMAIKEYFDDLNELCVRFYYMIPGINKLISPKNGAPYNNINTCLTLQEYLNAYGLTMSPGRSNIPINDTERLKNDYYLLREKHSKAFHALQDKRSSNKTKKGITIDEESGLDKLLLDLGDSWKNISHLNKDMVNYLTGGWFEEWVYHNIKKRLGLDCETISIGCHCQIDSADNEFDVLFILNNNIHYIECKTAADASIITSTLDKSNSLKQRFGLTVKPYIFIFSDDLNDAQKLRAKSYNIIPITKDSFDSWDKIIDLMHINPDIRRD